MNALGRRLRDLLITASLALGCSETGTLAPNQGSGGQAGAGGGTGAVSGTGGGGSGPVTGGSGGLSGSGGSAGSGAGSGGTSPVGGAGGTITGGSGGTGGAPPTSDTFYVSGRDLFDRCGEKVVLRGVNEMIVWTAGKDGVPEFTEIAKTGANAVRIVWTAEGSAAELDVAIQNAVAEKLIPIVENHDATGDLTKLPAVVDYWTQTDVVTVLKKHAPYLLLNIANEAGASGTQAQAFSDAYKTAITRIRGTGVTVPLVIDASGWGQDIDVLQAAGPGLIEHDPEKNLLFSVHMWWDDANGTRVTTELDQSVQMGLPLIVGEFAQHAVSLCDQQPFAYSVLLTKAQEQGIGWLAWSWGALDNGDCANEGSFDMTVGGVFGNWEETWGGEVAVTHAASIQNTSVRPQSMLTGACSPSGDHEARQ